MAFLLAGACDGYARLAVGGARTVAPQMNVNYETPNRVLGVGPYFGDNTWERKASLNDPSLAQEVGPPSGTPTEMSYETPNRMIGVGPSFGDNTWERKASLNQMPCA